MISGNQTFHTELIAGSGLELLVHPIVVVFVVTQLTMHDSPLSLYIYRIAYTLKLRLELLNGFLRSFHLFLVVTLYQCEFTTTTLLLCHYSSFLTVNPLHHDHFSYSFRVHSNFYLSINIPLYSQQQHVSSPPQAHFVDELSPPPRLAWPSTPLPSSDYSLSRSSLHLSIDPSPYLFKSFCLFIDSLSELIHLTVFHSIGLHCLLCLLFSLIKSFSQFLGFVLFSEGTRF